ncbi:DUF47 domain-containing protein [Paenisporosarcina sp. TG20]|uniref:DUF47 domain-containing protein n=1 Tax=Paenisporosarcina sp. TG20 TaxID=1211706 RepID=UPI0002FEE94E|nr:DUF47 family protein [Paenisporosarcina sp. TG20]
MFSTKKQDPFFSALLKIAENVNDATHYANDFTVLSCIDLKELSVKIKNYEIESDTLIHELIIKLNKSFMTPIEREDILQLAVKMNAVLDGVEYFIAYLDMYSIIKIDDSTKSFFHYLVKSTDEFVKAMELMDSKKLHKMRDHVILIKGYKRKCNDIYRTSMKHLFLNEKDPIRIIQFKDIYEKLEDVAGYCENVANTIETIIMRNV